MGHLDPQHKENFVSQYDPVGYGRLTERVDRLMKDQDDQNRKLDEQNVKLDKLIAKANEEKGAWAVGTLFITAIGSIVSIVVSYFFHKG